MDKDKGNKPTIIIKEPEEFKDDIIMIQFKLSINDKMTNTLTFLNAPMARVSDSNVTTL